MKVYCVLEIVLPIDTDTTTTATTITMNINHSNNCHDEKNVVCCTFQNKVTKCFSITKY